MSLVNSGRMVARSLRLPPVTKTGRFLRRFNKNLAACDWSPHPDFSVFTQYDRSFYLRKAEEFLHKYRCFWAVSRTIRPQRILEIGCAAGSSADAYLSATPMADYVGFDWYESPWWRAARDEETGRACHPGSDLDQLFRKRGFGSYRIHNVDLRTLTELPCSSDFVVVDAAHDFENEYADLNLALTAKPQWIFVDDVGECLNAVNRFLKENRPVFTAPIDYIGGGLVIRLQDERPGN